LAKEKPQADNPAAEPAATDAPSAKRARLLWASGAVAVLALAGLAAAQPWRGAHAPGAQVQGGPGGVVFYAPPEMTVNIQSDDGRPAMMKVRLALELPDRDMVGTVDENAPRITDAFETFLRQLRPSDLAGEGGSLELRSELARRINLVIAPAKVRSVLVEDLVISPPTAS
jgi:flagellar basal body-associated protein FliL